MKKHTERTEYASFQLYTMEKHGAVEIKPPQKSGFLRKSEQFGTKPGNPGRYEKWKQSVNSEYPLVYSL